CDIDIEVALAGHPTLALPHAEQHRVPAGSAMLGHRPSRLLFTRSLEPSHRRDLDVGHQLLRATGPFWRWPPTAVPGYWLLGGAGAQQESPEEVMPVHPGGP